MSKIQSLLEEEEDGDDKSLPNNLSGEGIAQYAKCYSKSLQSPQQMMLLAPILLLALYFQYHTPKQPWER